MRSMVCIKIELVNITNSITDAEKNILDLTNVCLSLHKNVLKNITDDQSALVLEETHSNPISIRNQFLVHHLPICA